MTAQMKDGAEKRKAEVSFTFTCGRNSTARFYRFCQDKEGCRYPSAHTRHRVCLVSAISRQPRLPRGRIFSASGESKLEGAMKTAVLCLMGMAMVADAFMGTSSVTRVR